MLRTIAIGFMLLAMGCGDDSGEGAGNDGGTAGGDLVLWECTCFSRESATAPRSNETITYCSENDPTQMLSRRSETANAMVDRIGGCDPCVETDEEDCDPAENR